MRTTTTSTDANTNEEEHEKRISHILRELKIKTGVLRRLSKEREMYEREVLDFTSRIEKDERIDRNDDDETNDNNNARQRKQCLEESKAMVRDTFVRLEKAFVDLEEFVETLVEGKEDFDVRDEVTGKEEFRLAKEQVERVKPSLC